MNKYKVILIHNDNVKIKTDSMANSILEVMHNLSVSSLWDLSDVKKIRIEAI